jgi:hypothetical protein
MVARSRALVGQRISNDGGLGIGGTLLAQKIEDGETHKPASGGEALQVRIGHAREPETA